MSATQFDRDSWARWYAQEHLRTDPGVGPIFYLPSNAPEREIRFVEVNNLLAERSDNSLDPIDFGIDAGTETAHQLFVLDVTPQQWDRIQTASIQLPSGWSLADATRFPNE